MVEIIGVRFKDVGKIYYFSPAGHKFSLGNKVIVETARGVECGDVVIANRMVKKEDIVPPLKDVIQDMRGKNSLQKAEYAPCGRGMHL